MPTRRRKPEELVKAVRNLWDNNVPAREIADQLGVSRQTVSGIAIKYAFPKRVRPGVSDDPVHVARREREAQRRQQSEEERDRRAAALAAGRAPPPMTNAQPFVYGFSAREGCQYPMWGEIPPPLKFDGNGGVSAPYCGAERLEGLPYCEDHSLRCFPKLLAMRQKALLECR